MAFRRYVTRFEPIASTISAGNRAITCSIFQYNYFLSERVIGNRSYSSSPQKNANRQHTSIILNGLGRYILHTRS